MNADLLRFLVSLSPPCLMVFMSSCKLLLAQKQNLQVERGLCGTDACQLEDGNEIFQS
jgi:hypothetical protein